MKTPSDPARLTVWIRPSRREVDPNNDTTPQHVFEKNLLTLDERHLLALANQIADGVQASLVTTCNCLDNPNLREVVSTESMKILRVVLAHQRHQAATGFE